MNLAIFLRGESIGLTLMAFSSTGASPSNKVGRARLSSAIEPARLGTERSGLLANTAGKVPLHDENVWRRTNIWEYCPNQCMVAVITWDALIS